MIWIAERITNSDCFSGLNPLHGSKKMNEASDLQNLFEELTANRTLSLSLSEECIEARSDGDDASIRSRVSEVVSKIEGLEDDIASRTASCVRDALVLLWVALRSDRIHIKDACIEKVISHIKSP